MSVHSSPMFIYAETPDGARLDASKITTQGNLDASKITVHRNDSPRVVAAVLDQHRSTVLDSGAVVCAECHRVAMDTTVEVLFPCATVQNVNRSRKDH